MLPFFWYMLKVIICSGILYAYYWLFLRNKVFHVYNRFYLLVSMVLSMVLPLLKINFWQPAEQQNQAIRVLQAVSVGDEYMTHIFVPAQRHNWTLEQLYTIAYLLVSIIFFLVLLRTLFLIRTLLKKYPVQQIEEVAFVNTQHNSTPFSFLQYIFWNSSIDIDTVTGRQIFKHEVAHIQQKHTHDKLFVNIVLILCWCNPFFWLYRKELNMIHEFIADKKAVEDSDTAVFAAMILQAAYPNHHFELVNNFFYSPIKRRLLMLSKNKNPKANYIGRIMVLPLIVFVFAAFSLKAKNYVESVSTMKPETRKSAALDILSPAIESPVQAQTVIYSDTIPAKLMTEVIPDAAAPLYIVNGKETVKTIALAIKPDDILDVRVIKNDVALQVYGDKGKNGVVIINTKTGIANQDSWTGGSLTVHGTYINKVLGASPLLVVDNIEYPGKTLNDIAAVTGVTRFENIDIYAPSEAMKTYGEKAKDGAIIAYTTKQKQAQVVVSAENDLVKTDTMLSALQVKLQRQQELSAKALYEQKVVVGMKLNKEESLKQKLELEKLNQENAKPDEVKVVMGRKMSEQELQQQKLLLEKRNAELQLASSIYKAEAEQKKPEVIEVQGMPVGPVFTRVEQNPQFTGGSEAWKKFLQEHLKANIPVDHGAKAGIYKVVLKFIVHADGSLSDITCENDPGYGTCAEAIRFIKTTPKWQPAIQNGQKVNAYLKQPITFVIEE
ncbi:MAG: M56 family metallopeptidase [Ferruginibacter sp.]